MRPCRDAAGRCRFARVQMQPLSGWRKFMNKNEYQITATTRGGQLLQKTMKERQLTFREVGDAVGVTHTNVHHWITRRVPMLRWAVRLKELYGIPVEAWMKEI